MSIVLKLSAAVKVVFYPYGLIIERKASIALAKPH